jgi:hypothetical protein
MFSSSNVAPRFAVSIRLRDLRPPDPGECVHAPGVGVGAFALATTRCPRSGPTVRPGLVVSAGLHEKVHQSPPMPLGPIPGDGRPRFEAAVHALSVGLACDRSQHSRLRDKRVDRSRVRSPLAARYGRKGFDRPEIPQPTRGSVSCHWSSSTSFGRLTIPAACSCRIAALTSREPASGVAS